MEVLGMGQDTECIVIVDSDPNDVFSMNTLWKFTETLAGFSWGSWDRGKELHSRLSLFLL